MANISIMWQAQPWALRWHPLMPTYLCLNEKYVYSYPAQPLLWKRFIDDISAILTSGFDKLDDFITRKTK